MGTQTVKRNETTRRIKGAATEVFAEAGFAGARVDEIARRARVNKAMIYYHIGDKKALYAEALHDVFRDMSEGMARNIQESQTAEEKLKRFIHNLAETMDQHSYLPAIILRELASGGQNIPAVVIQDFTNILNTLTKILEEGVDQGLFIQTTPFVVHMMVVGAVNFFKASGPIRSRHPAFPDTVTKLGTKVSGEIAAEIEKLILKAVRK